MAKTERIILYHGSKVIVDKPIFGYGKETNDYGRGFYLTKELELAKEWACPIRKDGIVNKYSLDLSNLKILDLQSDKYNILHWITILIKYRIFDMTTPDMYKRKEWLIKKYNIDIDKYDLIKGYRADDSYFSFARAFLSNEISINKLAFAMNLGKLGEQYVLKSKKAFNSIKYIDYTIVDSNIYFDKRESRDLEARKEYTMILDLEDDDSMKIDDIIKDEKSRN